MSDLGAETLFMSSGEVFEKLSRGVIDGVTFTYEALTAFKLTEDIQHTMRVPGGLYNTTWFLVMNEAAWEGISEEDRAAIEAISGAAFSERVGAAWNAADAAALEAYQKLKETDPDYVGLNFHLAKTLERLNREAVAADGGDGAAALAELRAQTGVEY